jgi:radical SAM superfamily enzyme YgiQ (UPF0313 family)
VFDAGCVGEGELTFVELIRLFMEVEDPTSNDYAKIPGICFHQSRWVQVNPGRELIKDLDTLPYPERDLLGEHWKMPYSRQVHLISSRGCPYDCSFCSSSLHWKRFRYFSPEYTANEIEHLRDKYNPKEFYFFDDLFIANRKRFKAICEKFRERGIHQGITFRSYARVDLIDEELADLFEEFNFVYIDFGFESNAQTVLDYFRKRNVTPEINQRAIDILAKRRVSIGANIIIGSPPETEATLDETVRFIERNRDHINRFSMGPLFPLPGTPIWHEAQQRGLISDSMTDWERIGFDPDNFDMDRYPYMCDGMDRDTFYRRYLDFRALAREVNLIGQLRQVEYDNQQMKRELETIRGSRLMQAAWGMRDLKRKLRETIEVVTGSGDPKSAAATATATAAGNATNGASRRDVSTIYSAGRRAARSNGAGSSNGNGKAKGSEASNGTAGKTVEAAVEQSIAPHPTL